MSSRWPAIIVAVGTLIPLCPAPLCGIARWNGTRPRRRQQRAHGHATCRLTSDRHLPWIATERSDVLLHPLQRGDLVEHAGIAGLDELREVVGEVAEAERPEPVVDRHSHHTVACECCAVIHVIDPAPGVEHAAVDPHQHRQSAGPGVGRPNVEVQAVVAGGVLRRAQLTEHARHRPLRGDQAVVGDIAHAGPRLGPLRRP